MNMPMIKQLAFELMGNKSSHDWKEKGNKYYHGERVALLAVTLRKILLPDDDSQDDILTAAAWFHDIMNGMEDHAVEGAKRVREILNQYCTKQELDAICEIIEVHDDRYSDRDFFSEYIKIHQDADHLDHFGTFDIWMRFLYTVPHGETMMDVVNWFEKEWPDEARKQGELLNYDISKKIYEEKCDYVRNFIKRFTVEGTGGVWDLNGIILPSNQSF